MEAFPKIRERVPNARLIVAGGNHPAAAGYWESIQAAQPAELPTEFLGYVPSKDIPKLFRTSTLLIMPYDSSTGSSGPAHQACEYGLPIVCADIPDFRCMAVDDDMAILFYKKGDADDLAEKVIEVLESPDLQERMSQHNYHAGVEMMMATVVRTYLRWFELHKLKRQLGRAGMFSRLRRSLRSADGGTAMPVDERNEMSGELHAMDSGAPRARSLSHKKAGGDVSRQPDQDAYDLDPELDKAL
jgi:glycosyltransferase involved in cell wall biosynthesis